MTAISPPRYPGHGPSTPPPPAPPAPPLPQAQNRSASGRSDRVRRYLLVGAAIVIIAVSLVIDVEAIWAVPVLFVLVVPFEKMFPRHRQKLRRPQVGTDIGYALAGPLLQGVGVVAAVVVGVLSMAWLPGLLIRPLVAMIPPAITPFVGIALFDLAIYWAHRWYHEVPFLWRFHAIHHSPEHMDWISGFRNHPFDGTLIAPAFVFLLAAGFDAEFTGALAIIQIILGIFLHANVRWRLRWLHKLVITPEFHHWHHANEPGAINSNYSVFLPAWDLLFGTYFMPKNRRPQVYGVTEHVPTGMAAQLWHPLRGMGNPLRVIAHPIRSLKGLIRFTRQLLRDMWRSATRPRRRSHDAVIQTPAPLIHTPAAPAPLIHTPAAPAPMPPPPTPPPPTPASTGMPGHTVVMPSHLAPTQRFEWDRPVGDHTRTRVMPPTSLAEVMNWDADGDRPPFRQ